GPDPLDRLSVTERLLEIEPEHRLLDLGLAPDKLFARQLASLLQLGLHSEPPSCSWREMNFVLIGSLAAASFIASFAVARSTPSISKITRPGLTTATQPSGAPLPFPIRVSAGFLVIGLFGNTPFHIFPPRLMNPVIATREGSLCFLVYHAGSRAFTAYSPNDNFAPRSPRALT